MMTTFNNRFHNLIKCRTNTTPVWIYMYQSWYQVLKLGEVYPSDQLKAYGLFFFFFFLWKITFKKLQKSLQKSSQKLVCLHSVKNNSLIWRRHWTVKFWLMLGALGLLAGRDLYRATPAVTLDLGFSGLIRRQSEHRSAISVK
jgi:hypothetical protein